MLHINNRFTHKNLFFTLLITSIFLGCGPSPVISIEKKIQGDWTYESPLEYVFNIDSEQEIYDLFFTLTFGSNFGYQNLYVKITTIYPDQSRIDDIVSLNLTDGKGTFLGDCGSSTCEINLLLQEKFKFRQKGEYTLIINQNSRKESLSNVFRGEINLFKSTSKG